VSRLLLEDTDAALYPAGRKFCGWVHDACMSKGKNLVAFCSRQSHNLPSQPERAVTTFLHNLKERELCVWFMLYKLPGLSRTATHAGNIPAGMQLLCAGQGYPAIAAFSTTMHSTDNVYLGLKLCDTKATGRTVAIDTYIPSTSLAPTCCIDMLT
jgi:hypothetical protein